MKTDTKTVVWAMNAEKSEEKVADKGAEKSGMAEELEDWKVPPSREEQGGVIPLLELAEMLDQHKIWVESGGQSGSKADLCSANLAGAELTGVNLQGANLHKVNLRGADLSMANLQDACLVQADLRDANLLGTELRGANLMGAKRSEEHTSELQSQSNLVCRLLLEKKKKEYTQ